MAAVRSATSTNSTTTTTTNVVGGLPTGTLGGDLLIATVAAGGPSALTMTTPATGWTQIAGTVTNFGGLGFCALYFKTASGTVGSATTEPGTWTWVVSAAVETVGNVTAISSPSLVSPINVVPAFTTGTTGTINTPVSTTTVNGCLILGIAACESTTTNAGATYSYPANTTADASSGSSATAANNVSVAHGHDNSTQAASGVTTARTITITGTTTHTLAYTVPIGPVGSNPFALPRSVVSGISSSANRSGTY